ncbi:5-formyltetrahydrofolate cyclo-ligase family protein [Planctomycetes bacterium Pan216]|uniref:5-formyltetrahydrofolate cyclo-ligase n=1 Tax=Kolteria novifilia TaxID=2527975 RepID=A0A518B1U0_9BACT|nr:5-formyltetrahydrofolate cyclo-ligase family protein [Planctomycetes bacterium Pan216]
MAIGRQVLQSPTKRMASPISQEKDELRLQARRRRRALAHREERSVQIASRVQSLPEYSGAKSLLAYVGIASEVGTGVLIASAIAGGIRVAVPYCVNDQLRLCWIESLEELVPGAYRIPEPAPHCRERSDRIATLGEVDLALIPGLAFDENGGRLGQGAGYYDRLLEEGRTNTALVGLAFDCQIVASIPVEAHDVPLPMIVTESRIIRPSAPPRSPSRR